MFAAVGRRVVWADRLVGRLTKGRLIAAGLKDLPCLLLTTTGRRSGQPRTSPLLYLADGDAFVVIGSNWGRADHPAWSGNLLANPAARVTVGGAEIPVRARLVEADERAHLRKRLLEIWPAYLTYEERSGRHLRVFRLERAQPST
jgi:deazaflavin-dependent oxidoreductase (nitroreductase family)